MTKHIHFVFILLWLSFGATAGAQTKDFREPGFKGSVALSIQTGALTMSTWGPGVEVSLGKMFNRNHYHEKNH